MEPETILPPTQNADPTPSPQIVAPKPSGLKGFVWMCLILLLIGAIALGSYLIDQIMVQNRQLKSQLADQAKVIEQTKESPVLPSPIALISPPTPKTAASPTPTPTPAPTGTPKYTIPNWISFQSLLHEKCAQHPFGPSYIYGIQVNQLPFTIDTNTLEIYTNDNLFCTETVDPSRLAYGTAFQAKEHGVPMDWKQMYMYNDVTVDKFGTDFYGLKGTTIGIKGDITYSIYFSQPTTYCSAGSPPRYFADNLELILRAEKKFPLSNNENLYINATTVAITPDQEQYRDLLKENASPCSAGEPRLAVAVEAALGSKVKSRLFANLDQLNSPQKEALDIVTKLLNTIIMKP